MATIRYYKDNNNNLGYATRKRYHSISSFIPFNTEIQKAVLIGNGAYTSIKTSSANLCDYVRIDDTRWFVTGYEYKNGGQVELFLQRDVVGEFGIDTCFGKIERGYTETFLRNRKELSLNQRLIDRKKLISSSNIYGNYYVNNHNNEMWGILYFSKPDETMESVNIPILNYVPEVMDYPFIANNSTKIIEVANKNTSISFVLGLGRGSSPSSAEVYYDVFIDTLSGSYSVEVREPATNYVLVGVTAASLNNTTAKQYTAELIVSDIVSGFMSKAINGYEYLTVREADAPSYNYNNAVIKITENNVDSYLKYTVRQSTLRDYGNINPISLVDDLFTIISNNDRVMSNPQYIGVYSDVFSVKDNISYNTSIYTYTDITDEVQAGNITIDIAQMFVSEPYFICVMPLYDVSINNGTYNIQNSIAFNVFNSIILKTSGENGLLVDAQIYPYCPTLSSVNCEFTYTEDGVTNKIPLFNISSCKFFTNTTVSINPNEDIKKDYIERQYSIVTPSKTSKFDFNYYDYFNTKQEQETIVIKTALKPFNIISSAVIQRQSDSLIGMTYNSDLYGCTSSGSEFECSIASNAYETYLRQNSNYQQLFELDKQELQYQHKIELQNEITSTVLNTLTATQMGAIGGAALGGGSKIAGAIGASVGGLAAGATVGAVMGKQVSINKEIRAYEEDLQQQRFDLTIGTIKNLPNSINRISSFNEITMEDFCYVLEIYECSEAEKSLVDTFIDLYGYGIGVYGLFSAFYKRGGFLRGQLIKSSFILSLHNIIRDELAGGIYYYE